MFMKILIGVNILLGFGALILIVEAIFFILKLLFNLNFETIFSICDFSNETLKVILKSYLESSI